MLLRLFDLFDILLCCADSIESNVQYTKQNWVGIFFGMPILCNTKQLTTESRGYNVACQAIVIYVQQVQPHVRDYQIIFKSSGRTKTFLFSPKIDHSSISVGITQHIRQVYVSNVVCEELMMTSFEVYLLCVLIYVECVSPHLQS